MKSLFIYFLLIINTFVFNYCFSQNQKSKEPFIQLEKLSHDYGKIDSASDGTCSFIFKNNGLEDLIIYDAKGSCGCTVPTFPTQPIKPGEFGLIYIMYDTKIVGYINKSVIISTNATNSDNGFIILRIKGEVVRKQ